MLHRSFFHRAKAVATELHYRKVDRGPLIEKTVGFFDEDHRTKNIVIPEYVKNYHALSAFTPDGRMAGGCVGFTAWNELRVDLLAVNPEVSVAGTGTALLKCMEELSRSLDCTTMAIDVYSWQAKPFCEKLGFREFAVQDNMPVKHRKHFMEKKWMLGDPMDPIPLPLSAAEFVVRPSEVEATEEHVHGWLQGDCMRRAPDVAPYDKAEYATEVILEDGTFAAGCAYETLWNDLHISYLCTNGSFFGRGIGSLVLDRMTEIAREKGCNRITLETMSWQAKPFYEKNGFRQFGVQEDIPPNGSRYYLEKVW